MTRKGKGYQRHAVAAAVFLALAGAAQAQSSNATLRGAVTGAAVANAEVTATNTATGFTLRTHAAADGRYALVGLPPGSYKIVVTGSGGARSERTVTLQVGQAAELDLALGGATQQVVVTGVALVDKKTSEVGTYVTPQQLQRLPQVTRNFLSQADLAPGVNVEYDKEGNVRVRSGGMARSAINVYVDGVGQKDYVLRGGVAGQGDSRGNPFPQSAIAEYKVISQNYKAEFDQLSGAAIVAATKSGTNELHGEAFVDYTSSSLRSETPGEEKAGKKVSTSQKQFGFSLGGPIIQDRLHYFMAYEGKKNRDPQTVVASGGAAAVAALPADVRALQGPVVSPFNEDLFFGKIDWTPSDTQRVDLSVKLRKEKDRKHLGGTETDPFSSNDGVDEKRLDLRHQFFADTFTNEARITYEDAFFFQEPVNFANGARYRFITGPDWNQVSDVLNAGGNNYYQRKGQKGFSLQDDFTYTGLQWNGSHAIKLGAKIKRIDVDALERDNVTPQFSYDMNPAGKPVAGVPYKVEFGSALAGIGDGSVKTTNTQFGIYVQDDWDVNKQLQLNLGLRWDYERSPVYLNYQTPADVLAALNAQDPSAPAGQTYAQTLAKGGININDYISRGNSRSTFTKALQPRLGFSFDVLGDRSQVVYGGYGRAYDRNIFDVMQLERTKGTYPSQSILFQTNSLVGCTAATASATCVPWNPAYLQPGGLSAFKAGTGREVNLLNNNLKTPYTDQFALGLRSSFDQWQTEVSITRIKLKDSFVFLLGNRRPDGSFYEPGKHFGSPWGNGVPNFGGSLILGTNGIESTVDSLNLKVEKPYSKSSRWGMSALYTHSRGKENHNTDDQFTYLLDYPTVAYSPFLQSTVQPKHKLVATGTFDGPWDVLLGAKLTLASPKYKRDFNWAASEPYADVAELKSFRQFDFSVSKAFDVGAGMKLNLRMDVINLFDYRNWQDYDIAWGGAPGKPNVATPTGTLSSPPRTIKLGVALNW